MLPRMSNENIKTRRYGEAVGMLARVCLNQYPEADSNDVADAMGQVIGRSLPSNVNGIAMAVDVIDASGWPTSQKEADVFIGRYVREFRMLSRRARAKALRGLEPLAREVIDSSYPLRSRDDRVIHGETRSILQLMAGRSVCIAMLDEASDERSPIFESTRMVISSGEADRMRDYIIAWIGYMTDNGHPDVVIGQRLKRALNAPRLAILSSGPAR